MGLDVYLQATIDTGDVEPITVDIYHGSVSHNCNAMAMVAGCYHAVWRPDEIGIETAKDLIPHLENGILEMREKKLELMRHEPANGFGSYEGLLRFLESYLSACRRNPKTKVYACR